MSDGARCHYCRKVPCECPEGWRADPFDIDIGSKVRDAVIIATTTRDNKQSGHAVGSREWEAAQLEWLRSVHRITADG